MAAVAGGSWGWACRGWSREQQAIASFGPRLWVRSERVIGPAWLAPRLGRAGFVLVRADVVSVRGLKVTDVSPLAKLTGLTVLCLDGTNVADVSPLAKLTALRVLWLPADMVTEAQAEELRRKLPNCQIHRI